MLTGRLAESSLVIKAEHSHFVKYMNLENMNSLFLEHGAFSCCSI